MRSRCFIVSPLHHHTVWGLGGYTTPSGADFGRGPSIRLKLCVLRRRLERRRVLCRDVRGGDGTGIYCVFLVVIVSDDRLLPSCGPTALSDQERSVRTRLSASPMA